MPANRKIGATIALDGEQKFKQAVQSVNKELGTMKTEMAVLKEKTAGHANSLETLRSKNDILTRSLEKSREKQEAIRTGLQNSKERYEKAAEEVEAYRKEIEKEERSLEELKKTGEASTEEIESREKAIQEMKEADEKNVEVLEKARNSVEDWTQKLNRSEVEVSKASKALDENSKLMDEAEHSADGCATSIDGFGKKTNQATQELKNIDMTIDKVAGNHMLIKFLDMASEAAQKLVTATYDAAKELDEGYDTIITKTGASGKALQEMKGVADNVFSSMPVEMADVGSAVGEVNTRFHSTGEELEELSQAFIEFSKINETDVSNSVDKTDRIMKAFGVDAKDTKNVLGLFTKVGQDTGMTMETLMGTLDKNGASFRTLGFDLGSSAQMLAEFEANGADTEGILTSLKKAVANAAKEGKNANTMLSETAAAIVNAKTKTEALQIATNVFGTKGAATMVDGLRSGRISLQETGKSLETYGSIVEDTFNETLDPWDDAKVAMNNLKVAGSSLAGEALQELKPAINAVTDVIKGATKTFTGLPEPIRKTGAVALVAASALGVIVPKLIALSKGIEMIRAAHALSTIATTADTAATLTNTAATEGATIAQAAFNAVLSANPIALAVIAVAGLTAAVAVLASQASDGTDEMSGFTDGLYSARDASEAARRSMEDAGNTLSNAYSTAKDTIDDALASSEMAGRLADELVDLSDKTNRTAEEQKRMETIVAMLNELYPELALSIDKTTGNLNKENSEILSAIDNIKKMAEAKAYQQAYQEMLDEIVGAIKEQIKAEMALEDIEKKTTDVEKERQKVLDSLKEKQQRVTETRDKYNALLKDSSASYADIAKAEAEYNAALADSQSGMVEYNGQMRNANELLEEFAIAQGASSEEIGKANDAIEKNKEIVDGALDYSERLKEKCEELGVSVTGVSETTDSATESMRQAAEATAGLADQTGETADELSEDAEEIAATYEELYEKALDSINGQISLFKKMEMDSEVSLESMNQALISQQEVISNYSSNLAAAMDYVSSSGDEKAAAFVKSIADMGTDGAAYMDAFVKALQADNGSAEEILSNFASAQEAKERYAAQMAEMETQTGTSMKSMADTVEGAAPAMAEAATTASEAELDVYRDAEQTHADVGAANAEAYATSISDQASTAASAAGDLESAVETELADSDAYTWGSDLGQEFANGIWDKVSEVEAAARELAAAAAGYIHHSTPDKGPLAGDDKWGSELAENFASSMKSKTSLVGRAAEDLASAAAAGISRDVGSRVIPFEGTVNRTEAGRNTAADKIVVENRFFLGEQDITDLITRKVVKNITEMRRTASLARGAAYV